MSATAKTAVGEVASPGTPAPTPALPRIEEAVERLQLTVRFTFAFHAREVRFEIAQGDAAFERVFPETFSFHAARHDPTELFLQLDDLLTKTRLLGPRATARDVRNLMTRLLSAAPRETPVAESARGRHNGSVPGAPPSAPRNAPRRCPRPALASIDPR